MTKSLKLGMLQILFANIISLGFSLLTNFILPKYLSVETYSTIKTFQLYVMYVGILHFGYIDGMYLKYGGKVAEEIKGDDIQTNLSTLRIFQIVVTFVLWIIAIRIKDNVFGAFVFVIFPMNLVTYFKFLFQAIGEFGRYGRIMNLTAIVTFIINILCLFVIKTDDYYIFLLSYVVWNWILWIVLEVYLKYKLPTNKAVCRFSFIELKNSMLMGIPLTLGNFSSVILTSIDRWFVKGLLTTLDFAQYSFAVSTESFINVALTPITVTLYNYFCKNISFKEILKIRKCVMLFASYVVSCAFGAKFIMEYFLEKYMDSCNVMFILFSTQICHIVIKGIYINIYKSQKRQKDYLKRMICVVIIGIVLNAMFFCVFPCKEAFAIGTLGAALVWLAFCLKDFSDIKMCPREVIYLLASILIFICTGIMLNAIIGFIVYITLIILLGMILMREELTYLIKEATISIKSVLN